MFLSPFKNEAYLNFGLAPDRKKMSDALDRVKANLGKTYSLHTAREIPSTQREVIQSFNPSKKTQLVGAVERATLEDAETALQVCHRGAREWARTPVEKRIELLEKLADWMLKNKEDLSALMVLEVGKTWREADADTCEAIDFCRYYSREMNRLSETRTTQIVPGERCTMNYFPKGVCVVIAPWNFPLAILTGMTVAGLVTGNTVIFKPAETAVMIGSKLAQGLREVGFPESAFYFLPGLGSEIGPKLTGDARVDMVAFTGSVPVGLSIIEEAGKKPKAGARGVKKVIAEMGGKNALIVDEDADLDEALMGAVHSAFGFQGQKCSALSRLLVHEKVYDSFVPRFVEAAKNLKIGPSDNPEFQVGPVVDEKAQKRILNTIEEGKKRLKVLYSAPVVPQDGYYVPPTIFEVEDTNDWIFQNEIFGPVVAVKKVNSLQDAVKAANSVQYALTGGIYSRSASHIDYVKQEMEVGNLYVNRAITGAIVERHPFGGFKMSGIGMKAGGPDYLLQFMEPRSCAENTVRRGFAGE